MGAKTKKVIWRANRVISIETKCKDENRKENVYVLAQMIGKCQLIVFNLFNTDNNWENIDLNKAPILFCTAVMSQFIKCSNVYVQKIESLKNYQPPKYRIHLKDLMETRDVTLWQGTSYERTIQVEGSGGDCYWKTGIMIRTCPKFPIQIMKPLINMN